MALLHFKWKHFVAWRTSKQISPHKWVALRSSFSLICASLSFHLDNVSSRNRSFEKGGGVCGEKTRSSTASWVVVYCWVNIMNGTIIPFQSFNILNFVRSEFDEASANDRSLDVSVGGRWGQKWNGSEWYHKYMRILELVDAVSAGNMIAWSILAKYGYVITPGSSWRYQMHSILGTILQIYKGDLWRSNC